MIFVRYVPSAISLLALEQAAPGTCRGPLPITDGVDKRGSLVYD